MANDVAFHHKNAQMLQSLIEKHKLNVCIIEGDNVFSKDVMPINTKKYWSQKAVGELLGYVSAGEQNAKIRISFTVRAKNADSLEKYDLFSYET